MFCERWKHHPLFLQAFTDSFGILPKIQNGRNKYSLRPALMVKRPDATTILRPETRRGNFAFASSAGKLNKNIRLTP